MERFANYTLFKKYIGYCVSVSTAAAVASSSFWIHASCLDRPMVGSAVEDPALDVDIWVPGNAVDGADEVTGLGVAKTVGN